MVKNLLVKITPIATEEQLLAFQMPQNKKMDLILIAVQNMIQEYTGVLLSSGEVSFESDNEDIFPYYPVRAVTMKEKKNDTYFITYECGVNSENYIAAALCIAKEIYHTEELLSIETIKKYSPWLPVKSKYI